MTTSLLPPLITSLRTNSNSNQSSIFFSPPFLSSGMERKGLISNNMKGQNISSSSAVCCTKALHGGDVQNSNNKKIIVNKDEWGTCGEDVLSNGFSWPPRAYICTFCSREFKSAQALGGHMNVHRRDRARLRQSPPSPPSPSNLPSNSPNPKPSPKKPNLLSSSFPFISSSPPTGSKAIFGILPSLASHSGLKKGVAKDLSGPETLDKIAARMTSNRSFLGCDKFTREEDYINGLAKSGIRSVSLDLEIGRLGDSKGDVDLELRLGYS